VVIWLGSFEHLARRLREEIKKRNHDVEDEVLLELLMRLQLLLVQLLLRGQSALVFAYLLNELLFDFEECFQSNEIRLFLEFVKEASEDVFVVLFINDLLQQSGEVVDDGVFSFALEFLQDTWSEDDLGLLVNDCLQGLQSQNSEVGIWLLHKALDELLDGNIIEIILKALLLIWFVLEQIYHRFDDFVLDTLCLLRLQKAFELGYQLAQEPRLVVAELSQKFDELNEHPVIACLTEELENLRNCKDENRLVDARDFVDGLDGRHPHRWIGVLQAVGEVRSQLLDHVFVFTAVYEYLVAYGARLLPEHWLRAREERQQLPVDEWGQVVVAYLTHAIEGD